MFFGENHFEIHLNFHLKSGSYTTSSTKQQSVNDVHTFDLVNS